MLSWLFISGIASIHIVSEFFLLPMSSIHSIHLIGKAA